MPPTRRFVEYRSPLFARRLAAIKKQYPHAIQEIDTILRDICNNPAQGVLYNRLGVEGVRKLRMPIRSYRTSKRQGFRLVIQHPQGAGWVLLLLIYSKKEGFREDEIKKMIQRANDEFENILDEE